MGYFTPMYKIYRTLQTMMPSLRNDNISLGVTKLDSITPTLLLEIHKGATSIPALDIGHSGSFAELFTVPVPLPIVLNARRVRIRLACR